MSLDYFCQRGPLVFCTRAYLVSPQPSIDLIDSSSANKLSSHNNKIPTPPRWNHHGSGRGHRGGRVLSGTCCTRWLSTVSSSLTDIFIMLPTRFTLVAGGGRGREGEGGGGGGRQASLCSTSLKSSISQSRGQRLNISMHYGALCWRHAAILRGVVVL